MNLPQRLLGIDYGYKRIGLATGQTLTRSAEPIHTLRNNRNGEINWAELNKIITVWEPDAFVIGLPLNKDGSDSSLTRDIRRFSEKLSHRFNKPCFFENEYLSSHEAETFLAEKRRHRLTTKQIKKTDIDKIAASLILQRWLNRSDTIEQHLAR